MNIIEKCEKAFQKLVSFLAEPQTSEAIKAGVIQAFEYNFEIFWKAFKIFAVAQGFEDPPSPRKALTAAFALKIIEDEATWVQMMKDRNNTSHTYNETIALEIYERIKTSYAYEFEIALNNMKNFKG